MDDLNKKNVPENEDGLLSAEQEERNELNRLVEEAKAKTEEDVLAKNVQDWDGLVDETEQKAEEFVYEASENISEEKIEGIEAPEYDEDNENLCSICHRRVKYEQDGVQYEYCRRCRNQFLETKYNWKGVVNFIAVCGFSVVAIVMASVAIIFSTFALEGDKYMKEGKYISAYNPYRQGLDTTEYINEYAMTPDAFDCGLNTVRKMIKQNYESGYIQTIGTVVEEYFSVEDLEKKENAEIKAIYNDYNKIKDTIMAVGVYNEEFLSNEDFSKEALDKVLKTLEAFKGDEKYEDAFISYYQYSVCTRVEGTEDLCLKYLEEMKKERPDFSWLYNLGFVDTYIMSGKYSEAEKLCDSMIENDVESMDAYAYKIKSYRMQKKYSEAIDASKAALEVEKEINPYVYSDGSRDIGTSMHNIYFERAIVFAIQGDLDKAQTEIEQSYSMMKTYDIVYLYAVLSKLNGYEELYDEAMSLLQNQLPEKVQNLIDGKATFEETFVNGKAVWYR